MLRIQNPGQPSAPTPPPPDPDAGGGGGMPPDIAALLAGGDPSDPTAGGPPPQKGKQKKLSADKVSPDVARYMGSEEGPFQCDHCEHFAPDGSCDVVSGPIDPSGLCILFTAAGPANATMPDTESPQEDQGEPQPEDGTE